MSDVTNPNDFFSGLAAGFALLCVAAVAAIAVYTAKGGDLQKWNPFKGLLPQHTRPADQIRPWRFNLGFGPSENRRSFNMELDQK